MTHDQALQVCDQIATSSRGLRAICNELKISTRSFYDWVEADTTNEQRYVRAREAQADHLVDEMIEIADDSKSDEIAFVGINHIHRDRLKVDTRKFIASKLRPKKYGDKLDLTTGGDKLTEIKIEIINTGTPLASSESEVKE